MPSLNNLPSDLAQAKHTLNNLETDIANHDRIISALGRNNNVLREEVFPLIKNFSGRLEENQTLISLIDNHINQIDFEIIFSHKLIIFLIINLLNSNVSLLKSSPNLCNGSSWT